MIVYTTPNTIKELLDLFVVLPVQTNTEKYPMLMTIRREDLCHVVQNGR